MKLVLAMLSLIALVAPNQQTNCTGGPGPCVGVANSPGGIALQGVSSGGPGPGVDAAGNPAIRARANASGNPLLYAGMDVKNIAVFRVDSRGNGFFAGKVVGAHQSEQMTSAGVRVTTYASQAAEPALEDFGETTLVAGRAYVRLDPRFAAAVQSGHYLVFVTAQDPVAGALFVTQKTRDGFAIREAAAGHSTAAVDYRIVARPFGSTGARLPAVTGEGSR